MLAGILAAVLLFFFFKSFVPGQALFSNDGPLAVQVAEPYKTPGAFFGIWNDLFWLGANNGSFLPNIWGTLLLVLGPYGYTNFHVPVMLLLLGLCAAYFFRQLGFKPLVCILGGLAAALNSNFFSNACWGLSSRASALAMTFLALAAVESGFKSRPIIKTMLAGLAIGMSILEAGDNGAIFSLFVAAYAFFRTLFHEEPDRGSASRSALDGTRGSNYKESGSQSENAVAPRAAARPLGLRVAKAVAKVALMAVCAGLLAAQSLNVFQETAVKGITDQQAQRKEVRWVWATQWSLPKAEILRVIIPGLYGYRVDSPDGGAYWGWVGETPGWETHHQGIPRHSGAGEYAGVLVVLLALWGLAASVRNAGKTFSQLERKQIWFWGAMAVVAVLLGWGRFAPFYRIIYAMPYFSTIRNPMKFMHPFHLALMILFGYGLQGLSRRYLEITAARTNSLFEQLKIWWAKAQPFERKWNWGCAAAVAVSAVAFMIYGSARGEMVQHLQTVGFDQTSSAQIAKFSAGEVGWFILFLTASVGVVLLIQSGAFAGRRAKWAGIMLGVVLFIDMARANAPWIQYYDYTRKYSSNPVLDTLKEKPSEARVTAPPFLSEGIASRLQNTYAKFFPSVYNGEWLQHHFQYYTIQSLDVAQEPRMPADKEALLKAVGADVGRYWQLTNTRYVLGMAGYLDDMNARFTKGRGPFRIHTAFDIVPKPDTTTLNKLEDLTAVKTTNGPLALFEFTGALPRAKLYTQWQVMTNNQATLVQLADPTFDPNQLVLVAGNGALVSNLSSNAAPANVNILHYEPRKVELKANADAPAVLLLNDRFDPNWKVEVDGKSATLLQCNFIMRGVHLSPGEHLVTFRFEPDHTMFFITLGAVVFGFVLCGFLAVSRAPEEKQQSTPPAPKSSTTAVPARKV